MIRSWLASLRFYLWGALAAAGMTLWTLVRPGMRFISAVLLVAAIIALTLDVTRWQTGPKEPMFQSLAGQINAFAPATLNVVGKTISSAIHPVLWDPLLTSVLALPAWLVLFVLSLLLTYAARERRRIEIFIN